MTQSFWNESLNCLKAVTVSKKKLGSKFRTVDCFTSYHLLQWHPTCHKCQCLVSRFLWWKSNFRLNWSLKVVTSIVMNQWRLHFYNMCILLKVIRSDVAFFVVNTSLLMSIQKIGGTNCLLFSCPLDRWNPHLQRKMKRWLKIKQRMNSIGKCSFYSTQEKCFK